MKILKWGNPKIVELFERESKTLRRLNHPGVPKSTIDDFFTFVPSKPPLQLRCLVMDKVEGENLQKWIELNGRISQNLALDWLKQLVEILDVVHHTEFFHRDIKPANIIVQPNGKLVLVDFGAARRITDTYLAKVSASGGTSTRMGNYEITSIASPGYTPLEQINGKAVPQSDFYALGRTFVYLTTDISMIKLPVDKNTGKLLWRKYAPQIEKPFADFLDEMMAPFPGQRPQTSEVILQRLKKIPLQSKIQRVTRSKTFMLSAVFTLIVLGGLGVFKIVLPGIANALVAQGQKLEAENNTENAQHFFKWAIKIHPQSSNNISSFYFGKAGRNFTNVELAKRYLEKAIKYNPQDVNAYLNLALLCQDLRQIKCATANYKQAIKLHPNQGILYYELGSMYDEFGKFDLAEEQYNIAIELNQNLPPPMNNLSRLKNLAKKYDEAEALALKALELTKETEIQATLYKNLGWANLGKSNYSEANKYLQKSIDINGTKTDTYCLLAQVQDGLGETTQARIYWEVCMIAESNLPEVFNWRGQLLDRLIEKL
ncbi:serine/threonine-protein kinase [Nodularia sp. NIES-3585]|uniref:serine/threonine-protein kinase n=1 Tax=Nodularia sp. NIES-3585 TaxID=1973477 RepID=UPI000B5C4B24|nr:serine/threonine-protein kinase [Nodularia sp. NIES-3585]